ncbi:MAG: LTA synthase family protein [Lachnospiraceae bacterium]|nr:LTA synthase family protein [Lachnospiraceae bacterium]
MGNKKKINSIIDRIKAGVLPDIVMCGILAVVLEVILEICDWRSVSLFLVFLENKTWIFCYNCVILFLTFVPVFFIKRKVFVYIFMSSIWLVIGITNGIMLGYRNTPFSAVDIALLKSVLPIISNYLTPLQICLVGILLIGLIVLLVCLFLYCPISEKRITMPRRILCLAGMLLLFVCSTKYGIEHGILEDKFSNIRLAYRDYGTPYCFVVTLFDNGIDRPINYSVNRVNRLMDQIDKKQDELEKEEQQTPNIIFVQLESFFDVTRMKNLNFSEDPIPFFRQMMEKYSSGFVSMPTYGAGTVNTEFEIMTGMNKDFFGAGEYPFKSILQEHTSESICYVLKEEGYRTHAIHNNNASFYDRDYVYANLGFDTFTTMEMMTITEMTETNWVKDKILTKYIGQALDSTETQDFIYTVSVQGHGDYPEEPVASNRIRVTGSKSENFDYQYSYYASQLNEMDEFLKELIDSLEKRKEDTVLVVFGDHLPSLEIETEDMSRGTKFETEYFIWNNMGLEKNDENLQAYQLYSKVLTSLGIHTGVMNRYHQTSRESFSYQDNMKLLQYDLLYGSNYSYGYGGRFQPTDMVFGVKDIIIGTANLTPDQEKLYITGDGFTPYTDLYVNGKKVEAEFMGRLLMRWKGGTLEAGDEVYIVQRSKTDQRPVLWKSPVYVYQKNGDLVLKESVEE